MTWDTVSVPSIFRTGYTAMKLAWKILNVFAMYRVGLWWVLCPFPCDVFAVYPPGTPPLAPSVCRPRGTVFGDERSDGQLGRDERHPQRLHGYLGVTRFVSSRSILDHLFLFFLFLLTFI